jgi:predicted transcriptional regulator
MNRSFQRYITVKINKAPILEVSPIEAEQMNIHQLVDNYKRLQAQLVQKDEKIRELEQHIKDIHTLDLDRIDYINQLEYRLLKYANASDLHEERLEYIAELEYKLACALHAGEDQVRDGGRMSVDELSALDNV